MEGIILFADDKLLTYSIEGESAPSGENKLFKTLAERTPVLGVKDRDHVRESIESVGTLMALILDWQFDEEDILSSDSEDDETVDKVSKGAQKEDKTFELLMENNFYSLIYIYSTAKEEIETKYGDRLKTKFKDRIHFRDKANLANTETEADQILTEITNWKNNNKNLSVPYKWSQSINQSVHEIFSELSTVDKNWIVNLHETASEDGVNPEIEVITLLQNVLTEKIITKSALFEEIKGLVAEAKEKKTILSEEGSVAKLFQRIYYTDLTPFEIENVPIMTGDIFLLDSDRKIYGVIISPECDIQEICSNNDLYFEFLTFDETAFNLGKLVELFGEKNKITLNNDNIIETIKKSITENFTKFNARKKLFKSEKNRGTKEYEYIEVSDDELLKIFFFEFERIFNKFASPSLKKETKGQLDLEQQRILFDLLLKAYNQTEKRIHLMPSFKYGEDTSNKTAIIDFREGKRFIKKTEIATEGYKRVCKLNSPFIQELRQRYISYYGRVGVPMIPNILRSYNLKTLS